MLESGHRMVNGVRSEDVGKGMNDLGVQLKLGAGAARRRELII